MSDFFYLHEFNFLYTVLQRAAQHQENKFASQSMKSTQEVQLG